MDEHAQQLVQLMDAYIAGNFLTGLILPSGSSLPTTDMGPVAIGNQWYFWDSSTSQYLPQTVNAKVAKNFCKNSIYQVQQTGSTPAVTSGINKIYDMALCRATVNGILTIAPDVGPTATADNDMCPAAIKYTVTPGTVTSPAAADLFAHEHLIEGIDIAMIQGEVLSLSFSIWTNTPGTYSAYLANGGRDASYVANFTITAGQASTWVRIKISSIPALPTGIGTWNFAEGTTGLYVGIGMLVGTQWRTSNLRAWQSGIWLGSSANSNLCTVVNNQMKISGVKLEASPSCSYLMVPSFSTDLDELQRYYYTTFDYQSATTGFPIISTASASNTVLFSEGFPRRMCKAPTVVPYGWVSHSAGVITNTSSGSDVTCATLPSTRKGTAGQVSATSAKGDTFGALIVADARLT